MSTTQAGKQFLTVPLKKTWEVDFARPLRGFIAATYNNICPGECESALVELNRFRVYYASKCGEKHETSLAVCSRYADQVRALAVKFPIDETQIRIPFRWQDAFGKTFQELSSATFEELCAVFNVGAMQSQVADLLDTHSDDGLKNAAKLFQQAAGTFDYLHSTVPTVVVTGHLTPDLWPDTLASLSILMQAQAQECFVRKAMADQMKPAVIAKLAEQCAMLYEESRKKMIAEKVKCVWPKDWMTGIIGRVEQARALAQYHQAAVARDAKNYGEQVARLRTAKDHMSRAQKQGLAQAVHNNNARLIAEALAAAEKDNTMIYNALIPDVKTLSNIDKAPMAKPIPVTFPLSGTEFRDLFERIVPIQVQMALARYEERRSEILQQEIGKLRANTQSLNGLLASLNLPAALEDLSGGGSAVPQSLLVKAGAVRRAGGLQQLERTSEELPSLLRCNIELLDECDRLLNEEETSDKQLRAKFGSQWSRTPSEVLNTPIRAEAARYRGVINSAVQSDGSVKQRLATHREALALLSRSDDDIQRALPAAGGVAGSLQGSSSVSTLRGLMDQVQSLKVERDDIETELKGTLMQGGFSDMSAKFLSALSRDGAISEQTMSMDHLERTYGPVRTRVSQSLQRQQDLTDKIQRANGEFTQARASLIHGGASREAKMKLLATAYDIFCELKSNSEEGVRFYNDLAQMLVRFQGKVTDFCVARKAEKDEHMRDLTSGLAGATIPQRPGSTPKSPTSYDAGGATGQMGGARLLSSVNIGPGSAAVGSKTTFNLGGMAGEGNSGYCLPAMPVGFNPYGMQTPVYSMPAKNHGFVNTTHIKRR